MKQVSLQLQSPEKFLACQTFLLSPYDYHSLHLISQEDQDDDNVKMRVMVEDLETKRQSSNDSNSRKW